MSIISTETVEIDPSAQFAALVRGITATARQATALSWTDATPFGYPLSQTPYTELLAAWIGSVDMAARDYESAPASEALGLVDIIRSLAKDLDALRAGQITVQDAVARSMLAKQIFNGVRIYLNGTKLLSEQAKPINGGALTTQVRREDQR